MRIKLFSMIFLLLSASHFAMADDVAKERLIILLEQSNTLTANFRQQTLSENQFSIEEKFGRFKISKPLRFYWLEEEPFEQLVVSDGETIWVYDADLEQATYRAVGDSLEQSPAMILTQPRQALGSEYEVLESIGGDDLVSYRLYPNDEDATFSELSILFEGGIISELRYLNQLGQDTLIELSNVRVNIVIDEQIYSFTPPPGIDVIEQM